MATKMTIVGGRRVGTFPNQVVLGVVEIDGNVKWYLDNKLSCGI